MPSCIFCDGAGSAFAARIVRDGQVLPLGAVVPCGCATNSALLGGARDSGNDENRSVQRLSLVGVDRTVAGLPGGMESRQLTIDRVKQSSAGHRLTGDAS
jgi:hypothetical protein